MPEDDRGYSSKTENLVLDKPIKYVKMMSIQKGVAKHPFTDGFEIVSRFVQNPVQMRRQDF